MKRHGIVGTAALSLLLGACAPLWGQQGKPNEEQGTADKRNTGKAQAKAREQQEKGPKQKAPPAAKREARPADEQQPDRSQKEQQAGQAPADQPQGDQRREDAQQQRADQQQAAQQRAVEQQAQQRAAQQQANQRRQHVRLSRERQQQLIAAQQRRVDVYRQDLDQQQLRAQRYGARLQQQKRMANYRYYQAYVARMRQQQLALQRSYDYNNDPYFYTASSYRYDRGGRSYETNEYGVDVLRQAINNGYEEGYRTGQADQQDRWPSDYKNSYSYQDANYGYGGYYVNQADYNYYFREGFNRGYLDGYNSRTQYGRYSNGSGSILGTILAEILNLQSMR
jgi:hypothetical protein